MVKWQLVIIGEVMVGCVVFYFGQNQTSCFPPDFSFSCPGWQMWEWFDRLIFLSGAKWISMFHKMSNSFKVLDCWNSRHRKSFIMAKLAGPQLFHQTFSSSLKSNPLQADITCRQRGNWTSTVQSKLSLIGFRSSQYQCETFKVAGWGWRFELWKCLQTASLSSASETVIHSPVSISVIMAVSFTGVGVSVTAVHTHRQPDWFSSLDLCGISHSGGLAGTAGSLRHCWERESLESAGFFSFWFYDPSGFHLCWHGWDFTIVLKELQAAG